MTIQRRVPFFKPYREHEIQQDFYTSDYDLSSFRSIEPQLENRFAIQGKGNDPALVQLAIK